MDELEEFGFDAFIMENHKNDLSSNEVEHRAYDASSQSAIVLEDLDISDEDHVADGQETCFDNLSPSGKRKRGDETHHHSAQRRRMY